VVPAGGADERGARLGRFRVQARADAAQRGLGGDLQVAARVDEGGGDAELLDGASQVLVLLDGEREVFLLDRHGAPCL